MKHKIHLIAEILLISASLISCAVGSDDPLLQLYGGDDPLYVAVGNNSGSYATVITSEDGKSWSGNIGPNLGNQPSLNGITYGKGRFVAVGVFITTTTAFSITCDKDGAFSAPTGFGTNSLFDVIYADNRFICVDMNAPNSTIYYSEDGAAWTNKYTSLGTVLNNLVSGDGRIMAAGNGELHVSSNGSTWYENTDFPALFPGWLINGMTYAKELFVLVGEYGGPTPVILTTSDGAHFSQNHCPNVGVTLFSIAYGRKRFVAVGKNLMTLYSSDGYSWVVNQLPGGTGTLSNITYGSAGFVAVGSNGGIGIIYRSKDGIEWSGNVCPPGIMPLTGITFAP